MRLTYSTEKVDHVHPIADKIQLNTKCLNRGDQLIAKSTGHPVLQRHRKALLSDLSALVRLSKRCEAQATAAPLQSLEESDYSQLVLAAFKLLIRAVRFFDVWTQVILQNQMSDLEYAATFHTQEIDVPPTPPADSECNSNVAETPRNMSPSREQDITDHVSLRRLDGVAQSYLEMQKASQQQLVPSERAASSHCLPLCLQTGAQVQQLGQVKRQSMYHRMSWLTKQSNLRNDKLASERLNAANELFLSTLSIFLGVHLITKTSTEILVNTQQSVNAGRSLLTVVEAIWDRDLLRSKYLEEKRDGMYKKITELVHSAQGIFSPIEDCNRSEFDPTARKCLADTAMSCVKGASECVDAARGVLELIGDFEFETIGAPSAFSGIDFNGPSQFEGVATDERQSNLVQQFPIPPSGNNQAGSATSSISCTQTTDTESSNAHPNIHHDTITSPPDRNSTASLLPPPPSLTDSVSSIGDTSPTSMALDTAQNFQAASFPSSKSSVAAHEIFNDTSLRSAASDMYSSQDSIGGLGTHPTPSNSVDVAPPCPTEIFEPFVTDQELEEVEANVMRKTFAHELTFNKEGQVTGGTLPALVERLTASDATPDAVFVSTFYLTFRLFSTPETVANALLERFRYCSHDKLAAGPVTLRVYNIFKGWLESHWKHESDSVILPLIIPFATHELSCSQPGASKRLLDLADKVSRNQMAASRTGSSGGKTSLPNPHADSPLPTPVISRSQLGLLKVWNNGGNSPTILDFEPLEIARQLTVKTSGLFCSISPEELLGGEWTKKGGSISHNVRAMITLSNDITNLVADTILHFNEHHKRAKIIKQWVKIACKSLELNNYDSLMAIVCSLDSGPIQRLKRTWDSISSKTKAAFEQLKSIVSCSKNYSMLRQRLSGLEAPCLPYLGIYLADLTMNNEGNSNTRRLSTLDREERVIAINFDKHVKTSRTISDLLRFQVPHHLQEVMELQAWIQEQFVRVRCSVDSGDSPENKHYRRSCVLEPREQAPGQPVQASAGFSGSQIPRLQRREGEFMGFIWR